MTNAAADANSAQPEPQPLAQFTRRAGAIAGPRYDTLFFVLSPLLCLGLAASLGNFAWPFEQTEVLGRVDYRVAIFVAIWTYAHLFAVVFRTHANPRIFAQHRVRFTAAPLLLFSLLVSSDWALALAFVLAMFWDVFHTGMQSFGLCRIYDARIGNSPQTGRMLDCWLNHVIYAGPILCGLSLVPILEVVQQLSAVGWNVPGEWVTQVPAIQSQLRTAVIALGSGFLLFYVFRYRRLVAAGYRISGFKVALLVSTAITSITAWGFLPPLEAFFVVNLFHGLQYFAIVWSSEKQNVQRVFGLGRAKTLGAPLAFVAMATVLLAGGALYFWGSHSNLRSAVAAGLVVSLMHFWYDGFVWSVRRNEV